MSKYKPYPQYKDSGVEWLGNIPNEWNPVKLKYLVSITTGNKDTENKDTEGKYPFFVRSKTIERINTYSYDGEAILTAGDGDIGKIFHYINGKFDFHQRVYMFYKFKNILVKFLYFYIQENLHKEVIKLSAKTTVDSLRLPMLQDFVISIPPLQQQIAIVNFLNNSTSKIDTLIQKQQNLIELLKEKRQALISHTVTKGLNPHVKMKDSGVEWLGEVPEHWEVKRVKFLFKIRKRIVGKEGYDVLSITQQGIKVKDIESNEGQLSMDYSKYQFANIGDFAMNHMDLLTGYVDISSFNGVISPDYRVFTLEDKNSFSKFYLYIFQNGYKNKIFYKFGQGSSQVGRWRLPTDEFNDFVFPYPSFIEQQEIANYLDNATCKIDTLISKSQKAIELLKERRTALISATVTGKIDVRETA